MSQSAVVTIQPASPVQQDQRFMATITITDSGAGLLKLATIQPQLFITASPPQNPSTDYSSVDVYKGNLLQVAGVSAYNFDAVCHSPGIYTVSAICYDTSGNSIPVTPASLTVFAVPQQDAT
jgi:hypothetical protein